MKQDDVVEMTWDELREFVEQMPDGTSVLIEVEGSDDGREKVRS